MNSYTPGRPSPIPRPASMRGPSPAGGFNPNPEHGGIFAQAANSLARHIVNGIHTDAGLVKKGAHWAFPHNPFAHPGAQAAQTGRELGQMFNPTSKQGLVNILSMFAGGPKDGGFEGEMAMQKVPGQFEAYKGQGSPLLRGLTHEGPIRPGRNYNPSIEKMVGNAKGVGGYRRANPMDVIEGLHAARQKLGQTRDSIKDYSNRGGFAARQAQERTDNFMRVDRAMGANSVPYVPRGEGRPFYDTQSADFRDRNTLLNLQKKMPDNPLLGDSNPIMQALYDMLFPGKGLLRKPTRPGGYPYGGGPFG